MWLRAIFATSGLDSYLEAFGTQALLVRLDHVSAILLSLLHDAFVTHFARVWAGTADLALWFGLLVNDGRWMH